MRISPRTPSYAQTILMAVATLAILLLATAVVGAARAGERSPWERLVALGVTFSITGPVLATLVGVGHVAVPRTWPATRGVLGSGAVGALLSATPLTALLALGVEPKIIGTGIAYTVVAGFAFGAGVAALVTRRTLRQVLRADV